MRHSVLEIGARVIRHIRWPRLLPWHPLTPRTPTLPATAVPPTAIRIRPIALAKLGLYARRCPFEIGGLGEVVVDAAGPLISDLFLVPQTVMPSGSDLESDGLFALLERLVGEGRDVGAMRLWWHSHADMPVAWSDTDEETLGHLPGEWWVAVVTNRRGDLQCRLDRYAPVRRTWHLPLHEVPGERVADQAALERTIEEEILATCARPSR